ncbi:LuxR C-terminal-related transcriptional regulator [Nesterenkonia massiliensis]|uniref:LuxR C-terminal-related transcriptional regulator n=1 Tax=Nesterenkonia massiliensis TaxID=1232429 RepID=A0ABT2HRQ1_9MICC|nr:LuxR C-terminal-related transcriptional regulator [Nesterenkonia massiliensis]MCT1607371.1 LuxR C-terminal-related transcriptional regulator [Nesterenkonia massiliensis]
MKDFPCTLVLDSFKAAARIVDALLSLPKRQSIGLLLPCLWGADDVVEELSARVPVLRVDGAIGEGSGSCPLAVALKHADIALDDGTPQASAQALRVWGRQESERTGDCPVVVIESATMLDPAGGETLVEAGLADAVRLVLLLRTEAETPSFVQPLQRAGRLGMFSLASLTNAALSHAVETHLGAPVCSPTLQRLSALSAGHPFLAKRVLEAALQTGVLRRRGSVWVWSIDEEPLQQLLGREIGGILGGLEAPEQELLVLTAISGRLPESWARTHYGEAAVLSLRAQDLLAPDRVTHQGFLDVRVTAEALITAVRIVYNPTELIRLWYDVGRYIPSEDGGPASESSLIWWAARAGVRTEVEKAERVGRLCISRSWYEPVLDIVGAAESVTPMLRVLRARALLATGQIEEAARALRLFADQCQNEASRGAYPEAHRQARLLAYRMCLFHPEIGRPILSDLDSFGQNSTPYLSRIYDLTWCDDSDIWLRELAQIRLHADWDELVVAQLWVGAWLGMRQHPGLGRLVLASLWDDLAREGNHPDIEDAAVTLMLLIAMAHDWRTDALRVELRTWASRPTTSVSFQGTVDLVSSLLAMQEDRMVSALRYATAAHEAFLRADAYGLARCASSLIAATASYVDEHVANEAHMSHRIRYPDDDPYIGLPHVRLFAEGLTLIGSGLPAAEVSSRLIQLGSQARSEGEWAQEQQLLLLALLGRSAQAVNCVLAAPWTQRHGRTAMIVKLAAAMASHSDHEALDLASSLIDAKATFFGLSVINVRWERKHEMSRRHRAQAIRLLLEAKEQAVEPSWLLSTFTDLQLNERECAVLRGLQQGLSTRAIARTLDLSPRTVESTISRLLHRFACDNRVELVSLGLLSIDTG